MLQSTYNDIQSDLQDGALDIVNVINRHVRSRLSDSFAKFTNEKVEISQSGIEERTMKSKLFWLLDRKYREHSSHAMLNIINTATQGGTGGIDKKKLNLRMKAQFLVNCLKQTPQLDLPKAFWRWALKSEVGEAKIAEFADNLTLYTNINKETAGWRLFRIHRLNQRRRVDIKTKRLALVLFFLTKLFANRRLKDAFDQIKGTTAPGRIDVAKRIIEMSKKRRQSAF